MQFIFALLIVTCSEKTVHLIKNLKIQLPLSACRVAKSYNWFAEKAASPRVIDVSVLLLLSA